LNPDRGFTFLELIDIRIEAFLLYIPAEYLVFPFSLSLRSATCDRKHIHNIWGSTDNSRNKFLERNDPTLPPIDHIQGNTDIDPQDRRKSHGKIKGIWLSSSSKTQFH